jgi:hypothetical protein
MRENKAHEMEKESKKREELVKIQSKIAAKVPKSS